MPEVRMKLISEDGRPNFGLYSKPLAELNYADFVPPGGVGPIRTALLGKAIKPKRWIYTGFVTPSHVIGCAIVQLNYAAKEFVYAYDRWSKQFYTQNSFSPLGGDASFKGSSVEGEARFKNEHASLEFKFDGEKRAARISIGSDLRLNADIEASANPLSLVSRVGYRGYNYTHKEAGLKAKGSITLKGKEYSFDSSETYAVIDYTLGVLARETFWNWASGGGVCESGERIGINLVRGINDTGETENAAWVGDELIKADVVNFIYNQGDFMEPWKISSMDGKIDLEFTPENMLKDSTNILGIIESRFHQPFGKFSGVVKDNGGKARKLVDFYGFVEEHYAKW